MKTPIRCSACVFSTPLGRMLAAVDRQGAVVRLEFLAGETRDEAAAALERDGFAVTWDALPCAAVVRQLDEYFRGKRQRFDLPLAPRGTDFQRRTWEELRAIPYGRTISYRELARRVGSPGASRAVGQANGANPIPVVIPCHRVVAADGTLGGYGGGLHLKERLLTLEGAR